MSKNLDLTYLVDIYGPVLTDKQREVIELYYFEDLSLAEIAENCGITRQGVRDSIKRGEEIITEMEQKLGFAAKYKTNMKIVDDITDAAKSIALYNGQYGYSEPIKQLSDRIIKDTEQIDL